MAAIERFPLTSELTEILKRSLVAFCDAVKGKFGCTAVIHNVDFPTASSFGSNKGTIVPEIKYSKQLSRGLKISVWKDDLTTHKADAVVNAANEQLNHGGGLALALSKAGGPQIQQESDKIIKVKGCVPTGEAVVTPAGNLPCQCIIHAVGPSVPSNPSDKHIARAAPLLEKAIWSIFRETEFNNLQSVAIPALSSGLFNFPRDVCANIIVSTVRSFAEGRQPQGTSLEIRLVNNDDPSIQEMLRACKEFLGPSDSLSGAMQISTSSATSAWPSLELGNLTLHLKQGSIEQEATDVIVNTIAKDLDLSRGFVSKAISEKAGRKIQDEIRKPGMGLAPDGYITETSAYKLNCRAVFHTVCAAKNETSFASQILQKVVTRCLDKARDKGCSSISFPAIGTGNLGFQKEEVAHLMIGAVVEFARNYKGKKMDVYFVIFPSDTDKYKAFARELDSIKKTHSRTTGKSSVFHNSGEASETPFIELTADSSEALREAKAWAWRILYKSGHITINNNHVIQFGQEDHGKLMALQTKFNVLITVFFRDGKCGITISGERTDVSSAALEVEVMLLKAQEEFAQAEENDLLHSVVYWQAFPGSEEPDINAELEKAYLAGVDSKVFSVNGTEVKIDFRHMHMETENGAAKIDRISIFSLYSILPKLKSKSYYARIPFEEKSYSLTERKRKFEKCGLNIVKVEKIENNALKQVFEMNEKRVPGKPKQLYQCVTAQFCELICRVGFQREYAPPKEQKYGAGIYFSTDVEKALRMWTDYEEEYIYIIEAQVLIGMNTVGSSELIVSPPTKTDPLVLCDSVTDDKKDIFVIFNGQQALPEFLITCKKPTTPV